jgi:predicted signal transduction protein with EAL and GGDEF domain
MILVPGIPFSACSPDCRRDLLKIERSFISGLQGDNASVAPTTSIIGLAAAFALVTVAEGVETTEQLDKLRQLHCVQLQGYLNSRPIPIEQIELMLAPPAPMTAPNSAANVRRANVPAARQKRRAKRRLSGRQLAVLPAQAVSALSTSVAATMKARKI